MREIVIDCNGITDKEGLHKLFAQSLALPEWCGDNLDALYDCLTDLDEPTHVTLKNFNGPNIFREMLLDAADTELGFSITFE